MSDQPKTAGPQPDPWWTPITTVFQQAVQPVLDALNGLDDKLDTIITQLAYMRARDVRIEKKVGNIMALVQIEQADLDQLDTDLDAATTAIIAKIEGLNLPAAQMDALKEDLDNLRAISAPAAPVEEG